MRTFWLLLLLLPVPTVRAELQLWMTKLMVNEAPRPLQPSQQSLTINFADVRENDLVDVTFELRNPAGPTTSIANLNVIPKPGACGQSGSTSNPAFFLLTSPTNPPGTLNAGGTYTFEVRYLPPKPQCYEAYLVVANLTFTLRGSASGRTVMFEIDTLGQRQIINGSTSDFGDVRLGEGYIKSYRIVNNTGQPVEIAPPVLGGETSSWTLLQAPESNRTVPVDGLYEFKTEFRPKREGLINGTLTVDGRVIHLVGKGLPGTVPDFQLIPSASDVDSASQAEVRIELAGSTAQAVSGTLNLVFEKDVGEMPDDTSIRFIENSSRSLPFTVPAGGKKAQFGGGTSEVAHFQTGTASGKIRLVATLGQWEHSAQINIRSDAPKLLAGNLSRATGTLTVVVSGFDNTRSASTAVFRFFDANSQIIGSTSGIEVTVGDVFGAFFRGATTGGLFSMRAAFPIQGDISVIDRVEVMLRNKLGPSLSYVAR